MPAVIERILSYRLRALIRKEFGQIRRDRRLALSLIVPPHCNSCSSVSR